MFGGNWQACLASSLVLLGATNAANAQNGPLTAAGPLKGTGPVEGIMGIPTVQPTVGIDPLQGAEPALVSRPVGVFLQTAIATGGMTTALPVQLLEVAVLPLPALTLASFSPQPASILPEPGKAAPPPAPPRLTLTYLNVDRIQGEEARSREQEAAPSPPIPPLPPAVGVHPGRHISPN